MISRPLTGCRATRDFTTPRGCVGSWFGGCVCDCIFFFFSSRRRHTRLQGDWSSDVCSSDLLAPFTDGLGFLPCSNGVHDDLDDQPRRRIYRQLAGQGSLPPGYATEDGVGLHYVGTRLHEAVSALFRQAGLVGAAWPGRQLRRAARCPPPALTREDAVPARTHRRRAGHAPL